MAVHIKIPQPWDIPERQITPEALYWNRRQMLRAMGLSGLGLAGVLAGCKSNQEVEQQIQQRPRPCRTCRHRAMTLLVWIDLSPKKKSPRTITIFTSSAAAKTTSGNSLPSRVNRGRWRSLAWCSTRRHWILTISGASCPWRSGTTASGVWRPGLWPCPGLAFPCGPYWSALSRWPRRVSCASPHSIFRRAGKRCSGVSVAVQRGPEYGRGYA